MASSNPPGGSKDKLVRNDPFARMMGPQMVKLEESMEHATKHLDEMNNAMEQDRKARRKKEAQKHVPRPLRNDGQTEKQIARRISGLFEYTNFPDKHPEKSEQEASPMADLTKAVQDLQKEIQALAPPTVDGSNAEVSEEKEKKEEEMDDSDHEYDDDTLIPAKLPELTELETTQLLSHGLAGFVSRLPCNHRTQFYQRIINDTTHWLASLFRVKDCTAIYHDDKRQGLLDAIRLSLCAKYPEFLKKGFECLYTKPPVIYISEAAPANLKQFICMRIGLPASCVCVVPCRSAEPGQIHKMDADKLQELMADHVASTRQPVLILAYASTPLLAQVDPLQKIKGLCKSNNVWLHIEGMNLATLTLMTIPTNMVAARTSDSCTLDLSSWFGFMACPCVTLYRKEASEHAKALSLDKQACETRLSCFPIWVTLQAVGVDGIVEKVTAAVELTQRVLQKLSGTPNISILNKKVPELRNKSNAVSSGIGELLSRVISTMLVFEMATPVVVFRYSAANTLPPVNSVAPSQETEVEHARICEADRYDDSLNTWFVETVNRELPSLKLESVKIVGFGTAIKFSPLENAATVSVELIEQFLSLTDTQLSVMNMTASHKDGFRQVVEAQDNLRYVEVPGWPGVGSLQYVQTEWLEGLDNLSDKAKYEISKINIEIVHQLKKKDQAFTLGKTENDLACARFGLIAQNCDLEELLGLVYTTGKEIEESSKFMEQMADAVRKGIEETNKDLEKENEHKLMQEGMLRQVPLVGSLVNWWAGPPSKEASNIKGRMFNLSSGKIKTTEDTYKHHRQIGEVEKLPTQSGPLKNVLKSPALRANPMSPRAPISPSSSQAESQVTADQQKSPDQAESLNANESQRQTAAVVDDENNTPLLASIDEENVSTEQVKLIAD